MRTGVYKYPILHNINYSANYDIFNLELFRVIYQNLNEFV